MLGVYWRLATILICGLNLVVGNKHDDEKRLHDTILRDYKKDTLPDNTATTGLGYVNVSIYVTPLYLDVVSNETQLSYCMV